MPVTDAIAVAIKAAEHLRALEIMSVEFSIAGAVDRAPATLPIPARFADPLLAQLRHWQSVIETCKEQSI